MTAGKKEHKEILVLFDKERINIRGFVYPQMVARIHEAKPGEIYLIEFANKTDDRELERLIRNAFSLGEKVAKVKRNLEQVKDDLSSLEEEFQKCNEMLSDSERFVELSQSKVATERASDDYSWFECSLDFVDFLKNNGWKYYRDHGSRSLRILVAELGESSESVASNIPCLESKRKGITDSIEQMKSSIHRTKEELKNEKKQLMDAILLLRDYCQQVRDSEKPEWQIIAERHGWGPLNQSQNKELESEQVSLF